MDFTLRCNSLKCRSQLSDKAVVTTCSHIFCLPCANSLGLSNANSATRDCPACKVHLPNHDDAAVSNLSPSEDYKTSVLSGLNPAIIIECASRAMAFWTYQTTQEIFYQEFLMKSMTERYQTLSGQMDKLIADANSEVSSLRDKLQAMHIDYKDLDQKNQQLAEAYKKKCKDNGQLHKLYQQAKQRQATDLIAEAAEEDASYLTRQLGAEFRPGARAHHGLGNSDQSKSRSDGSSEGRHRPGRMTFGAASKKDLPKQMQTNESQRAHLPLAQQGSGSLFRNQLGDPQAPNRTVTPLRQPLGSLNTNVFAQTSKQQFMFGGGHKTGKPSHRHLQRESVGMRFGRDRSVFGRQ